MILRSLTTQNFRNLDQAETAFHPTANYLAAAGGLDYQVYLWDLNNADANQAPVASTPSGWDRPNALAQRTCAFPAYRI